MDCTLNLCLPLHTRSGVPKPLPAKTRLQFNGAGILVTGGTSGLGAEAARVLAAQGAHVVIAGRYTEAGHQLAKELGEHASFVPTDVTDEKQVETAVATATYAHTASLRLQYGI